VVILLVFGTGDGGSTPLGTTSLNFIGNSMENILVVGVNTRSVASSLKKLGYNIYSADYFGTCDLQECVNEYKSILKQKTYQSCGYFTENFNSGCLDELAKDFVDSSDYVICLAGAFPENYPKKKIIGNKTVEDIENKYKLYKRLKNEFNLPKTFYVSDMGEACEIINNYPDKKFILKPINGSGGYGIKNWEKKDEFIDLKEFILQELIEGLNISVSVLSTGSQSHTILTSEQIIGEVNLGQKEVYGYCGNIAPLLDDKGAAMMGEDVINFLSLMGSNGVDFILRNDDLFLIEVNPRLQGTLECAEASLGINMMNAHMEACNGVMMDVPTPKKFAVKMIIHNRERSLVGDLRFKGIHDIPLENVIIEKGEPLVTVIDSKRVLEDAVYSAEKQVSSVYSSLKPL
jgi:predicted ATP-grasp superfamily ATP-dependent carboligase